MATMNGSFQMRITFDRPLIDGPIEGDNWSATRLGGMFFGDAGTASGAQVIMQMIPDEGSGLAETVSYSAGDPDVRSQFNKPALAFADFPVS